MLKPLKPLCGEHSKGWHNKLFRWQTNLIDHARHRALGTKGCTPPEPKAGVAAAPKLLPLGMPKAGVEAA